MHCLVIHQKLNIEALLSRNAFIIGSAHIRVKEMTKSTGNINLKINVGLLSIDYFYASLVI